MAVLFFVDFIMRYFFIVILLCSILFSQGKKWKVYHEQVDYQENVWRECGHYYEWETIDHLDRLTRKAYPQYRIQKRPYCTDQGKNKWNKEIDIWYKNFEQLTPSNQYETSPILRIPRAPLTKKFTLLEKLYVGRDSMRSSYIDGYSICNEKRDDFEEYYRCFIRSSPNNYDALQLWTKYLLLLDKDISRVTDSWGPYNRVVDNGNAGKIYIWEKTTTSSYSYGGNSKMTYNWIFDSYTITNGTRKTNIESQTDYKHVYVDNKNRIQKISIGKN